MHLLLYNVLSCVVYSPWVINFYWHASARPFSDKEKWPNLKMLVTWAGPLNLSGACAIFSVSVVPQPCPAHSLQSVRLRRTVSAGEIVPPRRSSSTSGSCVDFLHLRSTNWLLTDWGLLGYHEKVCQTCRLAETRPGGPRLLALFSQVATETSFHWKHELSRDVCRPSAVLNRAWQQEYVELLLEQHCSNAKMMVQCVSGIDCADWCCRGFVILLLVQVFLNSFGFSSFDTLKVWGLQEIHLSHATFATGVIDVATSAKPDCSTAIKAI